MTVVSRRNCKKCHRWRPISDYRPYVSSRSNHRKEYLNNNCEFCLFNSIRRRQKLIYKFNREEKILQEKEKIILEEKEKRKSGYYGSYGIDPSPVMKQAELSQWNYKRISEAAKVNQKTVYRWRKKINNMSERSADNLCIALGTSLEIIYPYA